MTNTKSTKRALVASVMALFLCFTMLLGTTYAWFTDSATSGVNKIVAGNMDIGVYWATPADVVDGDIPAESWKPLSNDESVFDPNALWEPGYTEAVFFKFVNEGSLALQYQLKIDILKETLGMTKDGADIQLSNYIQAYACNSFEWNYTDYLFAERDQATDPVGAPTPFHDTLYNAANGGIATPDGDNPLSLDSWQWLEPTETTYATLVLWMPTTVSNETNHDGEHIPSIEMGINVLATQYTYEEDSFGNQYDKDSQYPIVYINEIDTVLQEGKDVVLGANDLTISANDTTASSGYAATGLSVKGGTFDGNGKTVTVKDANSTWACAIHTTGGTIKNVTAAGAMRGIFMGGATSDVYIDNVSFDTIYTFNSDGGSKDFGVYITNSTMNGWTSYSNVHKEVVFDNCEFTEGNGYSFLRAYNNTEFKNCRFDADTGFEVQIKEGAIASFENCYYGDTLITAENIATIGLLYNTDASLVVVK